ncbi:DUF2218 domain-containing protein [Shimia sp. MMG029]|uniref:DUF2218 domain-containing protein n=1 Tax=Shimia sp. MMG029 TaxID=3021978 RepID=UPI0022FF1753|nr:DUF2218 domain-containing protein [Shimia sp. MMG029]MDA5557743.1 DUF2218 domain-containing protein [Shimia sp. MMG029]
MTSLSQTTIFSPRARGYVTQLTQHFGHKIRVEHVESEGECTAVFHFSAGTAHVRADEKSLTLSARAATVGQLRQIEDIIGAHLERFAFREDLRVVWPEENSIE